MKRLILTLALLIPLIVFSQGYSKLVRVTDNTTTFGRNLPQGTIVIDLNTDEIFILTAAALSTNTLTTATKAEIDVGFQDLTWDAANGHIEISDGTDADVGMFSTANANYGFAPGSSGATTSFLRGDGTWATPPGGGDVSATGSPASPQIAYWQSGTTITGSSDYTIQTEGIRLGTGKAISTSQTATNTFSLAAYDVDGTSYVNMLTLTAGNTPAIDLHSSATINSNAIAYSGGAFHDGFSDFDANEHFLQSAITNISSGVGDGVLETTSGTLSTITKGIANGNIALVDDAGAASGQYLRFTTTGVEGRTASELASDVGVQTYYVEFFNETSDGASGTTHTLTQQPVNATGLMVMLNGVPIPSSNYTYTPATPSVQVTIAVKQYDEVAVSYTY